MKSPRFSLLTLLLLGTIAGLSFAVWKLGSQVRPLKEEVKRLRAEVGELHIEDPTKLHAMQVETDNELEWKWRIWIPAGMKYKVRSADGEIPDEGFPGSGGSIYIRESGEHVIRYVITRDSRDDKWYGKLVHRGGSVGRDIHAWVKWGNRSMRSSGVGFSTYARSDDQIVEIIRYRVENKDKQARQSDKPTGFMIWMEPIP